MRRQHRLVFRVHQRDVADARHLAVAGGGGSIIPFRHITATSADRTAQMVQLLLVQGLLLRLLLLLLHGGSGRGRQYRDRSRTVMMMVVVMVLLLLLVLMDRIGTETHLADARHFAVVYWDVTRGGNCGTVIATTTACIATVLLVLLLLLLMVMLLGCHHFLLVLMVMGSVRVPLATTTTGIDCGGM